jgi:cytochrome c oxidase subunit 1/cytochrome c oxidase subunit I+III
MKRVRAVASVAGLPSEVYGPGNITWWGALGGEVIEGFVVLLAVFAYFYLRHASPTWPPLHTPLPSLGVPILNLVLMLASVVPAWLAARAAKTENRYGALVWLSIHGAMGVTICVIRYFEFFALNVRWDANAYGSINWAILFAHGYTMLFDVVDTLGLVLLCLVLQPEEKHYVDITENSFFWYFMVISWLPLFVLVFLSPRW